MAVGSFCLVLHGHLPWVAHHGRWPHGEDWLFEAAAETWLPLLRVLDTAEREGLRIQWTLGLMPILLEQLATPAFRNGFVRYLEDARDQAEKDENDFNAWGHGELSWLAQREVGLHADMLVQFEAIESDIAAALVRHAEAGRLELLSSNATHGFHPLILHDACARAQIRAGLAASTRHLGHTPSGIWLPECAYRPDGPWQPVAVHGDMRDREGVATLFGDEGVRFFCVENHLITGSTPVTALDGDRSIGGQPDRSDGRAWGSWLEPHRVVERGVVTPVTVLGRAQDIAEQVWNAEVGFPGDGRYREFHKRHGMRGLRYWRVTGRDVGLGEKAVYSPDDAREAIRTHADHFAWMIRDRLAKHQWETGREGIVCAPFDAELFGHWWAEGPEFLLEVARRLQDGDVVLRTVSEALAHTPADKAVTIPRGTWGEAGDERVWNQDQTKQYWEMAYRAEDRFLDLWHRAPWRTDDTVSELLTEAGRQLLLLQASDWPFVITTNGAPDYGWRRVYGHYARFDDLCAGVEDVLAGAEVPVQASASLAYCQAVDGVFPELQLSWWT